MLEAFADMPDPRRSQGKRHTVSLCLAIFPLAVVAGNRGFLAIGDWVDANCTALGELFAVERVPSYSTIWRMLLHQDYQEYAVRVALRLPEIGFLTGGCSESV
ncbi:MAG: transposase family protein [Cyanobacteriota bacterium]